MKGCIKFAIVLTLVEAVLAIVVFMGYITYSITRVIREPVRQSPSDLGLEYEEVTFPSKKDHLTLRGWWISGGSENCCIILVHGGEKHRADPHIGTLSLAKDLTQRGYNLLLFDMRNRGESDGKRSSVGYYERRDLLGAIDYVTSRGVPPDSIGILGFSLGAAVAILVAGDNSLDMPVVSDSSFADLPKLIEKEARKRIDLPSKFNFGWMCMIKVMYGIDLGEIRPLRVVSKLKPDKVMIIHGAEDEIVPPADALLLHAAANNGSQGLWIVPEASHTRAYKTNPQEYVSKVADFFDRTLNN